jgi:hypothetical protein
MKSPAESKPIGWPSAVILALLALSLLYVLSYAPVVRWTARRTDPARETLFDGDDFPVYRPLDWLIYHTPLRTPLFAWASLFGAREQFESAYDQREWDRNPIIYTNTPPGF